MTDDDVDLSEVLNPAPEPVPAHETTLATWSTATPWLGVSVSYSHEVQW